MGHSYGSLVLQGRVSALRLLADALDGRPQALEGISTALLVILNCLLGRLVALVPLTHDLRRLGTRFLFQLAEPLMDALQLHPASVPSSLQALLGLFDCTTAVNKVPKSGSLHSEHLPLCIPRAGVSVLRHLVCLSCTERGVICLPSTDQAAVPVCRIDLHGRSSQLVSDGSVRVLLHLVAHPGEVSALLLCMSLVQLGLRCGHAARSLQQLTEPVH
mmetsp:Transcript_17343/g.36199  ORF Transcript_17343/g.36199 Transcript_17343/m.36199 type:complete len:217 (-) Transcript_17343:630-1280(-)